MKSFLNLFNAENDLLDYADEVVRSAQVYPDPEDSASREQFVLLAKHERKRQQAVKSRLDYRQSKLTSALDISLGRAAGQQAVAGLTCICLRVLEIKGASPTLYAASKMAAKSIAKSASVDGTGKPFCREVLIDGEWDLEHIGSTK